MAEEIKGYKVIQDFTSAGAGTSIWCIAEKDGKKYFIKQFLSPVLVSPESRDKLPAPMVDAMQKTCVRFVAQKRNLYAVLNGIQTGAFVAPQDLLVYNGHYLAVSPLISSAMPASEICHQPPWDRLMLMRTMVLNMKTLAANHIVHSDIKLDNLLIENNGQGGWWLKLIDFDSGFFETDPPRNGNDLHGDMVYFAPEAMIMQNTEGESDVLLDYRMDQFAVGLVLHQMWCGSLPVYNAEEYANAAEALLCGETLVLSPFLPEKIRQAVEGLLALEPEDRMPYDEVYALLGQELVRYKSERPDRKPVQEEPKPDETRKDIPRKEKVQKAELSPLVRPIRIAIVVLALVIAAAGGCLIADLIVPAGLAATTAHGVGVGLVVTGAGLGAAGAIRPKRNQEE